MTLDYSMFDIFLKHSHNGMFYKAIKMGSVFMTIAQLFCKHNDLQFMANLYGDKVNYYTEVYGEGNIVRSLWKCKNCGKIIGKGELNGKEDSAIGVG